MNDLVEIWKSKPIPEGPFVLRTALPASTSKLKMTALMAGDALQRPGLHVLCSWPR